MRLSQVQSRVKYPLSFTQAVAYIPLMQTTLAPQKVVHSVNCSRVFKNYDISCPRCQELAQGSTARPGWANNRRELDQQRCAAIKRHFEVVGADGLTGHQRNERNHGCDTAFEW